MTTLPRDKMSTAEHQHLPRMQMRTYRQDDRLAKRALLDEMEVYTGMHGKSIIRRFDGPLEHQPHRQERGAEYGPEHGAIRAVIWEATNYVSTDPSTIF